MPKLNRTFLIILLIIIPYFNVRSQVTDKGRILTVTGIINDEDNNPVSGVSIMSGKLRRGTISEQSGIYNIISIPGDTITFSALGLKHALLVVPSDIDSKQYTRDIILLSDTIAIKDVHIFPWNNYEAFKRAVLAEQKPRQDEINMYENLAAIQSSILNTYNYKVTPEAGFRMAMAQNNNASMYKGQFPPNNLLNPFAWAKLINGIKNGMLKNQKDSKPAGKMVKPKKKKS